MKITKKITDHQSVIPYIGVTTDGKYMISGSKTETIIWSIPNFEKVAMTN